MAGNADNMVARVRLVIDVPVSAEREKAGKAANKVAKDIGASQKIGDLVDVMVVEVREA